MVTMNRLQQVSLAHVVERNDAHPCKVAADAAVRQRQRCHHTHYQWLSLACGPDPVFDLSLVSLVRMQRCTIIYRDCEIHQRPTFDLFHHSVAAAGIDPTVLRIRPRCASVFYAVLDYPVMGRQLLAMISSLRCSPWIYQTNL
jgi:hypothetical protein